MGAVSSRTLSLPSPTSATSPQSTTSPTAASPSSPTAPEEQTGFLSPRGAPHSRLFESNQTYFGPRFVVADSLPVDSNGNGGVSASGISRAFWEEILAVLRAGLPQGDDLEGFGNVYSQLPPADMKLVTTLHCKVSLQKPSLKFIKKSVSPEYEQNQALFSCPYEFEFQFDSVHQCLVKVYVNVKEVRVKDAEGNLVVHYLDKMGNAVQPWLLGPFPGGMNQQFKLPADRAIYLSAPLSIDTNASSEPLSPLVTSATTPLSAQSTAPLISSSSPLEAANPANNHETVVDMGDQPLQNENQDSASKDIIDPDTIYPLVIVLESHGGPDALDLDVNRQMSYVMASQMPDKTVNAKITKQIVRIGSQIYVVQDIFGFTEPGEGSLTDVSDPTSTTKECIICMAEAKDTIVLPCRHLCLCHGCADVLRMQGRDQAGAAAARQGPPKCPICRQVFHSLLHIKLPPPYEARDSVASRRRSTLDIAATNPVVSVN